MRIATANQYDVSISTLQGRQSQLQTTQEQLSSGQRVSQPSDDPTAAAEIERSVATIGRLDANERSLQASRNSMTLSESALGDADNLLQQIRESMVQAGDGSYSDPQRAALGQQIKSLRDQLLTVANRSDGNGNYLFAGLGSNGPPFIDQSGGVTFTGVPGVTLTGNTDKYPLTVDGSLAFMGARSGNGSFVTAAGTNSNSGNPPAGWIDSGKVTDPTQLTGHNYTIQINGNSPQQSFSVTDTDTGAIVASNNFTAGQSVAFDGLSVNISGAPVDGDQFTVAPSTNTLGVFDVLDRTIADLNTPQRTGAQISQSNSSDLRDLDAVMGNIENIRSQVGTAMNNLDSSETRISSTKEYNQAQQSNAQDLDMVQGISDFQNQQTGYQAALQTYAMVQRMSLLNYLPSS